MKFARTHRLPKPEIPFISLADIAWQIIIFFLVAAGFVKATSLNLDLPGASNQPKAQQQEDQTLTVQASQGTLMLNSQPVSLADLQRQIAAKLADKKTDQGKIVVFLAGPDLTFQRNLDVLYAIQKAGGIVVFADE